MDSGNSGSLQSSSGGDEEYDSRADSISALMNRPTTHFGPISNPLQPQPPPLPAQSQPHTTNPAVFDPLSYYLRFQNPSSFFNANMVWPKSTTTLGSEPNSNSTDIINPMLSSPNFMACFTNHSPIVPFSSGVINPTSGAPPVATDNTISDNQIQGQNQTVARNPKKRSRASRRAPTTVLTTDTTNFRAMVQEFTGIPAPPFTSSPFPRSRLDLFGTPSSMRSSPLDTIQPPYLLRPFAQKVQSPTPFLSSASASSSSLLSSSSNNNIITSGSSSTGACNLTPSINYQLGTESSNLSNIFPLANSALLGSSRPRVSLEIPSDDHSHVKIGGLSEFNLGHGHVNTNISGLPNLISSDQMALRNDRNATNWSKSPSNNGDLQQMTSDNGNYSLSRNATSGKLIYSASSSSNFHGEKGSDNVAARGEGMVESWICSSD